ncbi:MAG TPA: hypothetical protein PLO24_10630 [Bacteroidales bacterium]|jgi:hypothetical protein|nr:hypothetical protein [Bacteroidales bacterium]HOS71879.1 hypothetical protein [Bacteroidales bacterium]HQH23390.1 hypothetical protein [Bacteroidales bacterium]HQJ81365.1 hypothetical protein [Bacteroidales bacterium]
MKNSNSSTTREIFAGYELTIDEMFNIRGGDKVKGEPIILPPSPPIKI